MAEDRSIVTYADVINYYKDKPEGIYEKEDDFVKAANKLCIIKEIYQEYEDFDQFVKSVKIGKISLKDRIIESPDGKFEINNKKYEVRKGYDDYVWAWLLLTREKRSDIWKTACIYGEGFYEWFLEDALVKIDEDGVGQKWHLFQYVLYCEMNNIKKFSTFVRSIDLNDKFDNPFKDESLLIWMAEKANVKEDIINTYKSNTQKNGEIKKAIWEAI